MASNETTAVVHPPTYNATIKTNEQPKQHRRRPRVPHGYGFVHCIKRALGVLLDLTTIVVSIKFSASWPARASFGVAGTIGGFIALVVDASEVVGTLDRSRRISRTPPGLSFCVDMICFILFLVGILVIAFTDFSMEMDPNRDRPWEKEAMFCLWVTVASISWRCIYLIWGCVDCCVRKSQRRERRVIYVPVEVENLPPNQPPRYSSVGDEENLTQSIPVPQSNAPPPKSLTPQP